MLVAAVAYACVMLLDVAEFPVWLSPKFQYQVGGLDPPVGTEEVKLNKLSMHGFPVTVKVEGGLLLTLTVKRNVSLAQVFVPVTTRVTLKLPVLV